MPSCGSRSMIFASSSRNTNTTAGNDGGQGGFDDDGSLPATEGTGSRAVRHRRILLATTNGDADCSATAFATLRADDFSDSECRTIFSAIALLRERGEPWDQGLLVSALRAEIENAAGLLLELIGNVVTTAMVGQHAKLVANASRQRRAVRAVNESLNELRTCKDDGHEALTTLSAELTDICRGHNHGGQLICAADVEPQAVEWLWPNRIAIGKVTLLAGDPGLGKSMATLGMAAAVTRGRRGRMRHTSRNQLAAWCC